MKVWVNFQDNCGREYSCEASVIKAVLLDEQAMRRYRELHGLNNIKHLAGDTLLEFNAISTAEEAVRQHALAKLTPEERKLLGLENV